jgi:peptidyl-prolyl cis-trans isomerase A (cyclophilin A)
MRAAQLLLTSLPLTLLLISCGPPKELVEERDKLKQRVGDLEREKARLEKEADALHAEVRRMKDEVKKQEAKGQLSSVNIKPGQSVAAVFDTSQGAVECTLFPDAAPLTVANFVGLAEGTKEWTDPSGQKVKKPLYNGTIFHRVIPNFMIQGGDPQGNGTGGPGYEFGDETSNGKTFDQPGLLAMANRGPDTNGSQFFITDRETPHHLDGKHTIFGQCANLDVVQRIADVPKLPGDKPVTDVVLRSVRILRK